MAEFQHATPPYVVKKEADIGGVNKRRGLLTCMDMF